MHPYTSKRCPKPRKRCPTPTTVRASTAARRAVTCKHKFSELDGTCFACGLTQEFQEIDRLRAEVRDLKARLRVARRGVFGTMRLEHVNPWRRRLFKALDLRVKNWRKP
jgi:hypothetical protein